jgi:DnaA N-terminal domain
MTRVSDVERYRRVVEEDSKRKRDLAGYERVRLAMEALEAEVRSTALAVMGETGEEVGTLWHSVLERIRASVSESTFRLWIEPLAPVGVLGETLFLNAPDSIRFWSERHYSHLLQEALAAENGPVVRVSFGAPSISDAAREAA